ncbi:MAG: O-antigen ligase family protein [Propionicimonas sp.]
MIALYILETEQHHWLFSLIQYFMIAVAVLVVLARQWVAAGRLILWSSFLVATAAMITVLNQTELTSEFRSFSVNCLMIVAWSQLLWNRQQIELAMTALGFAGLLSAGLLISAYDFEALSSATAATAWELRTGAGLPGGNVNIASMYIALSFSICIGYAISGRRTISRRLWWLGVAMLQAGAIVLTGSRKALIACAIAVLFHALLVSIRKTITWLGVTAAVTLLASRSEAFFLAIGHRFSGDGGTSVSDGYRLDAASEALAAFSAHPLGLGWGRSYTVLSELYYTHSNYLEVLVSLGVAGLVLYYWLPVISLRAALSQSRLATPGQISQLAAVLLVTLLVIDITQVTYLYRGPLIALALAVMAVKVGAVAPSQPFPAGMNLAVRPGEGNSHESMLHADVTERRLTQPQLT